MAPPGAPASALPRGRPPVVVNWLDNGGNSHRRAIVTSVLDHYDSFSTSRRSMGQVREVIPVTSVDLLFPSQIFAGVPKCAIEGGERKVAGAKCSWPPSRRALGRDHVTVLDAIKLTCSCPQHGDLYPVYSEH